MRRLHLQFYLAILATIVVFMVASVAFWQLSSSWRSEAWGIETAGQFAGALLPPASAGAERRQQVLDALRRHLDADVALYDGSGNVLAASGHLPRITRQQLLGESGWIFTRGGPFGILVLDDGRRLVMRPTHHRSRHGAYLVVVPLSIVLAFALGAYPIARRLTGRLERLRAGVEQLGQGNLTARVRVEGRDEVASLARSFNDSAARIEELIKSHKLLLANCSHELRTPLARIRLGLERLSGSSDPAVRDELTRSIGELDVLIGEMLLASRLDTLKTLERSEDVDLLALAAEEAVHFDREVEGQQVTVHGDPNLLRRMIRNLLENAQRHAGGATRIQIGMDAGGHALVIVEDHGGGVAEADREKIFEPFYRAQGYREESASAGVGVGVSARGSGLGLAIVRQIARAHGGNASYATIESGGSRFVVTLPSTDP